MNLLYVHFDTKTYDSNQFFLTKVYRKIIILKTVSTNHILMKNSSSRYCMLIKIYQTIELDKHISNQWEKYQYTLFWVWLIHKSSFLVIKNLAWQRRILEFYSSFHDGWMIFFYYPSIIFNSSIFTARLRIDQGVCLLFFANLV